VNDIVNEGKKERKRTLMSFSERDKVLIIKFLGGFVELSKHTKSRPRFVPHPQQTFPVLLPPTPSINNASSSSSHYGVDDDDMINEFIIVVGNDIMRF